MNQRGTIRKQLLIAIGIKYNWLIAILVFSAFFLVFLDPKGIVIAFRYPERIPYGCDIM